MTPAKCPCNTVATCTLARRVATGIYGSMDDLADRLDLLAPGKGRYLANEELDLLAMNRLLWMRRNQVSKPSITCTGIDSWSPCGIELIIYREGLLAGVKSSTKSDMVARLISPQHCFDLASRVLAGLESTIDAEIAVERAVCTIIHRVYHEVQHLQSLCEPQSIDGWL